MLLLVVCGGRGGGTTDDDRASKPSPSLLASLRCYELRHTLRNTLNQSDNVFIECFFVVIFFNIIFTFWLCTDYIHGWIHLGSVLFQRSYPSNGSTGVKTTSRGAHTTDLHNIYLHIYCPSYSILRSAYIRFYLDIRLIFLIFICFVSIFLYTYLLYFVFFNDRNKFFNLQCIFS